MTSNVITGFTRQEVADLCEINPSRLSYLDRAGVMSPQKIGNPKRPICIYSWPQLLGLKAVFKLREEVSLQIISKLFDFLEDALFDSLEGVKDPLVLHDREILVCEETFYWNSEENLQKVLVQIKQKLAERLKNSPNKHAILEIVIIPDLNTLKGELIEAFKKSSRFRNQNVFDRIPNQF